MKLLWLCNILPGEVKQKITGKAGSGLWMDHVLSDLRQLDDTKIHILCPYLKETAGELDAQCSFATFQPKLPHIYMPELEHQFREILNQFQPDVIHSWGVEYAHTLAMTNAAESVGMLSRMAVSIQGLCGFIAHHYAEGIPYKVEHSYTFRDFIRQDNMAQQKKKFILRGENEKKTLEKVYHVIGRTHWDEACTAWINPNRKYHMCRETLRKAFYSDQWCYADCRKHSVFAPGCSYPVKGFHNLLEAFVLVRKAYPDATLSLTGKNYLQSNPLRENSYQKYLRQRTKALELEDCVHFLGSLDAEGMKAAYLAANVFAMPSTIENSPNVLGEAMLLGTPCVAADVGGVTTMMTHNVEGYIYQSTAPYMLAHYICKVFAMEDQAAEMGRAAKEHALITHDPEKNLQDLLNIYRELAW